MFPNIIMQGRIRISALDLVENLGLLEGQSRNALDLITNQGYIVIVMGIVLLGVEPTARVNYPEEQ